MKINHLYAIVLGLILIFSVSANVYSFTRQYGTTLPVTGTTLEPGSMVTECQYIFFKSVPSADYATSEYFVRDGRSGEIILNGGDCDYLVQQVLDLPTQYTSIHFSSGIYWMDDTIEVAETLRVEGDVIGPSGYDPTWTGLVGGSILILADNVTRGMWHWNSTMSSPLGEHVYIASFEEINLIGNYMNQTYNPLWYPNPLGTCPLIWIEGYATDFFFNRVGFLDCGTEAVRIVAENSNLWNYWFTNCFFERCEGNGIGLATANSGYKLERVFISNCHFYANMIDITISDENVTAVKIDGCTSQLTKANFVSTYLGANDLTITNNIIYDGGNTTTGTYSDAIHLNYTRYAVVSDNIIKNIDSLSGFENGIYLNYCYYVTLDNNVMRDLLGSGIEMHHTSYSSLSSNVIAYSDEYGIYLDNGYLIKLSCNSLHDNTLGNFVNISGTGIEVDGGAQDYSYIIYKDDGVYKAKNGSTGQIDYQSTNASYIGNMALGNVSGTHQETILIKAPILIDSPLLIQKNYTTLLHCEITATASMNAMIAFSNPATSFYHHVSVGSSVAPSLAYLYGGGVAGGINFTFSGAVNSEELTITNQWIQNVTFGLRVQGSYIDNFDTITVYQASGIGFSFNIVADSYLNNLITSSVAGDNFELAYFNTNDCHNWYVGGGSSVQANLYMYAAVGNEFDDIRVDYCPRNGTMLDNSWNNTFSNFHITNPQNPNSCALYVFGYTGVSQSSYNMFTNFQIGKGGGVDWEWGIVEVSSDYNTYTNFNMQDCTNSNSTSATSRIYSSLWGTTRIDD